MRGQNEESKVEEDRILNDKDEGGGQNEKDGGNREQNLKKEEIRLKNTKEHEGSRMKESEEE